MNKTVSRRSRLTQVIGLQNQISVWIAARLNFRPCIQDSGQCLEALPCPTARNPNSQAHMKIIKLILCTILMSSAVQFARAQATGFTYQGKLTDDCCPATGYYDMIFRLYGTAAGGSPLATMPAMFAVPVSNGLFSTSLDFGSSYFDGSRRWLQMEVRTNDASASFVTLNPRTELTSVPYAIRALAASSVASNGVSAASIAPAQVVKSLNGLKDNVNLTAGPNITLATN